jgi:uncharacterized Ntn-hydrolase superfamily protein
LTGREVVESMAQGRLQGETVADNNRKPLLIVRERGSYEGFTDRYADLRVDDSLHLIEELRRITELYDMTMLSREDSCNLVPITGPVAKTIQRDLGAQILQGCNYRQLR